MLRSLSKKERRQGSAREKESGFSLVELMIVVALIAIMAGIATPQLIQQIPKWHMSGTARNIMSNLMMARLRAIQENRQHRVRFVTGAPDTYIIERNAGSIAVPNWVAAGGGTGYVDVRILFGGGCVGPNIVQFEPGGTATGCSVSVSTIRGPALTKTVVVNSATGNVKIQ